MADALDSNTLPQATLTPPRRSRISAIWLIPLLAAAVAIGIAVNRILNEGPTISILFQSAEGVEANKTIIKYKDVKIGQVTAVELHQNYSKVMVTARIDKHAEGLMVEDAKFWVVQPQVTLSGVSGLSTLLSGNYIGFEMGKSSKPQRHFTGLKVAPVIPIDQPGREFELTASDLGSVSVGSPLYFRRLQVGQVMTYQLAPDGNSVSISVFVNAPFDHFVSAQTRFWNASGVDVSLGDGGLDVRTQSLVSLLVGGIAFATPSSAVEPAPATADTTFVLYADRATAMKQPETISRHYVLYFTESLRGLTVGAPVTLFGLPAGEVADVGIDIDPATTEVRGRVEIVAYPERLVSDMHTEQSSSAQAMVQNPEQSHAFFQRLVMDRGLRAQLRSGSLLTGQLFVAFDFFPDAPKAEVDWGPKMPVIPTVPGTVTNLEDKVSDILAKVDKIPFETIGSEVAQTLLALNEAIKDIDKAVNRIDKGVIPELKPAISAVRSAMMSADRVLKNTDATLLGKDAPGQLELRDALQEVSRAARSLRVLTDYLERNPSSLIRGKNGEKP
ncbi:MULTISPECIES: PqiB family protein [Thiorhodovibrio]|uniref:PqiB family protein n=1 Tax=Thiorhodovibrio TaxID=61593 RepID=UPI0019114E15|nr:MULTISPECIES: MlaD family protein [Thiorhodovibrio]MBK5967578.1 mammalian cell entry protein [Thiorhodovibrio winogradskyi]WPL14928.1 Paraquat-inducible protein B [Thiorhodovibrio litoralis]